MALFPYRNQHYVKCYARGLRVTRFQYVAPVGYQLETIQIKEPLCNKPQKEHKPENWIN